MRWIVDSWTIYQDWASNLDSESRFYIIAGSFLLISIYAAILLASGDRFDKYPHVGR